jgi:hypothetical protein
VVDVLDICTCAIRLPADDVTGCDTWLRTCNRRPASAASSGYVESSGIAIHDPSRPCRHASSRGRSRARHKELVALIRAEEAKLVEQLGGIVCDLERRIRVRKAKGEW